MANIVKKSDSTQEKAIISSDKTLAHFPSGGSLKKWQIDLILESEDVEYHLSENDWDDIEIQEFMNSMELFNQMRY